MAGKIEFMRGDNVTHTFDLPTANWSAGGKLFFTAKPAIDDDSADAAAVINKAFTDANVSDVTVNGVAYKRYTCAFVPADTNSINSGGETVKDYYASFQFVSSSGQVTSFPGNNNYLDAVVYFDIRRSVT